MIREVKFESQDRRIKQIIAALNENGIKDIEEANAICEAHKERIVTIYLLNWNLLVCVDFIGCFTELFSGLYGSFE